MSNWTGRRRRAGLRWRLACQETPHRVPETVFGEGSSPCQAHVDPSIGLGSPRVGLVSCKEPPNKPPFRRIGRHSLIRWVVNAAARQTPILPRVTSYFGPRWPNPIDLDRGRRDNSLRFMSVRAGTDRIRLRAGLSSWIAAERLAQGAVSGLRPGSHERLTAPPSGSPSESLRSWWSSDRTRRRSWSRTLSTTSTRARS